MVPATDGSNAVAVELERSSRFLRPPEGEEGQRVVAALDQLEAKAAAALEAFRVEIGLHG